MDGLRWLLLAFGILAIVGVYFYSRREAASREVAADADAYPRREPTFGGSADETADADIPVLDSPVVETPPEPAAGARIDPVEHEPLPELEQEFEQEQVPAAEAASSQPQKIVTLRVVARDRGAFRGDELILSLRGIGMRHGQFGIFHRFEGDEDSRTIFSAASLVEPGSFDLANIKEQEIPGISLFAVLPGPVAGVEAFDLMMAAARAIAKTMDADLLDESGSTLSIQRERYLREEIIAYEHSAKVAG